MILGDCQMMLVGGDLCSFSLYVIHVTRCVPHVVVLSHAVIFRFLCAAFFRFFLFV